MIRPTILSIAAMLLLWCAGYLYYMHYTTLYLIDRSTVTNAIAVLTGGRQRISTGVGLLKAGYAPILFISGVESKNHLKNFLAESNIKQDQVIYGNASTTEENAKEIAEFISNHNISSIRLVTSSYHMPRALLEVKKFIPITSRVAIVPHPVPSEYKNYLVLFKEYNKYLVIIISKFFQ
jgi:uncharacterized SAM-binding protein YcdF (DUF218 family)